MSDPLTTDQLGAAIAGALHAIADIDERTKRIEQATARQVFTVPEVCKRCLHRSRRWSQDHPWSLPDNGESEMPGRPRARSVTTCEDWYSVPLHVHEVEWFRMHRSGERSA